MSNVFWAAFGGGAAAGVFTLLAILGAEWFRWYLDRPLLKVRVSLGFRLDSIHPDSTPLIFLEAVNPHSKPVVISTFGLSYRSEEWGTIQVNPSPGFTFPYVLDGGHSITQYTTRVDLPDLLRKAGRVPSDLKGAWFKSQTGKVFEVDFTRWQIQALEKEF